MTDAQELLRKIRDNPQDIKTLSDVQLRILQALFVEMEKRTGGLKTYDVYRTRLWRAVMRLFGGGKERNFDGTFARSIDQQLTEAWNTGANEVGVAPEDMTASDIEFLQRIIENENDFITRIGDEIVADRDGGMTAEDFDAKYNARVDLWANRYTEVVNMARVRFGGKQRLEWQLGATEDHCGICQKLNGIVAFADEWAQFGIYPQNPPNQMLSVAVNGKPGCKGWRCDCECKPTNKRRSIRARDRLAEIALLAGGL